VVFVFNECWHWTSWCSGVEQECAVLWNFLVDRKFDRWALRWPLIVASDLGGNFLTCADVNPGKVVR